MESILTTEILKEIMNNPQEDSESDVELMNKS